MPLVGFVLDCFGDFVEGFIEGEVVGGVASVTFLPFVLGFFVLELSPVPFSRPSIPALLDTAVATLSVGDSSSVSGAGSIGDASAGAASSVAPSASEQTEGGTSVPACSDVEHELGSSTGDESGAPVVASVSGFYERESASGVHLAGVESGTPQE